MIEKQTEYKLCRDMRGSVILDRIEYTIIIKCDTCCCKAVVENLTEEEKDYDRNTSISTLKLILKLGFKINQ